MPRRARPEKLRLRLSPDTKRKLRAAADAREQSLNAFVLGSALAAADEALLGRRHFGLSAEAWEAFLKALDEPPKPNERLKRLLSTPSVFDEG